MQKRFLSGVINLVVDCGTQTELKIANKIFELQYLPVKTTKTEYVSLFHGDYCEYKIYRQAFAVSQIKNYMKITPSTEKIYLPSEI